MKDKLGLIIGAIALIGVVCLFISQNKGVKIGYIETGTVLEKYEGTKDTRKAFEQKSMLWQANTDSLVVQWENELKLYEKERKSMSEKERILKEELLRNKQQQLGQYQEAMNRKAAEEDQNMTQSVMNEINDYLNEYGKKEGYTFVFGTSNGNIVYANEAKNITQEVITGLNAEYKGK